MNRESRIGLSYWEHQSFFGQKDLIVVGAGIVGLSAALAYKKASPAAEVLVVDRELAPKGASSRNAGFACFGSMTELLADEAAMGRQTMLELVTRRWAGLQQLKKLVGEEHMDYIDCGGFEVFTTAQQATFDHVCTELTRVNQLLAPIVKHDQTFSVFADPETIGLARNVRVIQNKLEGQLHPGKMMSRLIQLCTAAGVEIRRAHELKTWEETESGISLSFAHDMHLQCKQLLLATNGFTKQLFPTLSVEPARNQILISEPIPDFRLKGTFHAEEGYLYFRNVGDRLLIGGGRHWDLAESKTDAYGENRNTIQRLLTYAQEITQVDDQAIKIDQVWSGILGVGDSKQPILERRSAKLVVAVRMGGMGVAIGVGVGAKAAEILMQK